LDYKINDMKVTGIYDIKSKVTGKVIYSGGSSDIRWDWMTNLEDIRRGLHPDEKLMAHFKKHGMEDYEMIIVEQFSSIGKDTLERKVAEHKESLLPKKVAEPETSVVYFPIEEPLPEKPKRHRRRKDESG